MVKEKNKSGKVVIIVLSIIVFLLVSYIIYDALFTERTKCNVKDDKNIVYEDNDDVKSNYLDLYSDLVQELSSKVEVESCIGSTLDLYRDGKVNFDSFKDLAFYMAYRDLKEEKGTVKKVGDYSYKELEQYSFDELQVKAKNIFGSDFKLEKKDYTNCPIYKYDSSKDVYLIDKEHGCGCTTGPDGPRVSLYKAIEEGNTIDIYKSVVYAVFDNNSIYQYYKDNLHNIKITSECSSSLSRKSCVDSSTKYKFTFKKEKNNYIFTNVTKVNE